MDTTTTRPPLRMTALEAATRTYATYARLHPDLTPAEIKPGAEAMLTRMIRTGHFIITDGRSAR